MLSVELLNYHVTTSSEDEYIYKTYAYLPDLKDVVVAENEVLLYLQEDFNSQVPKPISFKDQSFIKNLDTDKGTVICRMLSFLKGEFLGEVTHTTALFKSLGTFLGKLDLKLKDLTNYTIQARQWEWDLQYVDLNKKYINDIPDAKDRNLVHYFFNQFEEHVRPVMPHLRKQIIHNDANEWNVLVQNDRISSIIDFGDLAHSFLINELAIAITYACYDKENPLEWATIIIEAYHKVIALEEQELKVLYYLIAARLCTSVCNAAHSRTVDPENTYASISEKSAWKMLHLWLAINPLKAENEFRKAAFR